jgi:hypothetical protein
VQVTKIGGKEKGKKGSPYSIAAEQDRCLNTKGFVESYPNPSSLLYKMWPEVEAICLANAIDDEALKLCVAAYYAVFLFFTAFPVPARLRALSALADSAFLVTLARDHHANTSFQAFLLLEKLRNNATFFLADLADFSDAKKIDNFGTYVHCVFVTATVSCSGKYSGSSFSAIKKRAESVLWPSVIEKRKKQKLYGANGVNVSEQNPTGSNIVRTVATTIFKTLKVADEATKLKVRLAECVNTLLANAWGWRELTPYLHEMFGTTFEVAGAIHRLNMSIGIDNMEYTLDTPERIEANKRNASLGGVANIAKRQKLGLPDGGNIGQWRSQYEAKNGEGSAAALAEAGLKQKHGKSIGQMATDAAERRFEKLAKGENITCSAIYTGRTKSGLPSGLQLTVNGLKFGFRTGAANEALPAPGTPLNLRAVYHAEALPVNDRLFKTAAGHYAQYELFISWDDQTLRYRPMRETRTHPATLLAFIDRLHRYN